LAQSIGTKIRYFRPALTSVLVVVLVFATIYVFAILANGVGRSVPVRPVVLHNAEQDAHCLQFVENARSEFGPEWKRRLEPGNTACAQQIQAAWERDWTPRQALPDPVVQEAAIASAKRLAMIAPPVPVPAQESKAHSPANVAIIAGAAARVAGSDTADHEVVTDSEDGIPHGIDRGNLDSADGDEDEVDNGEQEVEPPRSLSGDTAVNDGQADDTRELNTQQLSRHGRPHTADMQRSRDDDSDANETAGSRDSADY
jgi:hypothetical protein